MKRSISIATQTLGYPVAEEDLYLTRSVLDDMAATIGAQEPERGGINYGLAGRAGADHFEHDEAAEWCSVAYRPSIAWARKRQAAHFDAKVPRLVVGLTHTHPWNLQRPSPADGNGEGDLGAAAQALENNEYLTFWAMLILCGAPGTNLVLWPWVLERDEPDVPKIARVVICKDASEMPERRFPADLAAAIGGLGPMPRDRKLSIDVDAIQHVAGIPVERTGRNLTARGHSTRVLIDLDHVRPGQPLKIVVHGRFGPHLVSVGWRLRSRLSTEARLGILIRRLLVAYKDV